MRYERKREAFPIQNERQRKTYSVRQVSYHSRSHSPFAERIYATVLVLRVGKSERVGGIKGKFVLPTNTDLCDRRFVTNMSMLRYRSLIWLGILLLPQEKMSVNISFHSCCRGRNCMWK